MATSFPVRFPSDEQKQQAEQDAALRGKSLNAHILDLLGVGEDKTAARFRFAAWSALERVADSEEFDQLDAQLAEMPRSSPSELGFTPRAGRSHAA